MFGTTVKHSRLVEWGVMGGITQGSEETLLREGVRKKGRESKREVFLSFVAGGAPPVRRLLTKSK